MLEFDEFFQSRDDKAARAIIVIQKKERSHTYIAIKVKRLVWALVQGLWLRGKVSKDNNKIEWLRTRPIPDAERALFCSWRRRESCEWCTNLEVHELPKPLLPPVLERVGEVCFVDEYAEDIVEDQWLKREEEWDNCHDAKRRRL